MPLLYEIPIDLLPRIATGGADLVGAIIKDSATGQILGHVQQASGATGALTKVLGTAFFPEVFLPLQAVDSALGLLGGVQNEQIKRGIAELQNGMIFMQNLQYGTLALSGLGLGVSVAGFALTLKKLNAIEKRLEVLTTSIGQVTKDRREDELGDIFANVGADLQNVETLTSRREPRRVAEQLQLSLSRATRLLERRFLSEADVSTRASIKLEQLDMLWSIAAAIRLCQDASVQALFAADELEVAIHIAQTELDRHIEILNVLSPDILSRMVGRSETDQERAQELRKTALAQAHVLTDGIKGGVLSLAGQIGIARQLQAEGMSGLEYMRKVRDASDAPLLFLASS